MSIANSLVTLKQILNALPSATKPSLVRSSSQRWRDDFSGTSLSTDWEVTTGAGQSINVTNSELRITANILSSTQTIIRHKKPINIPCRVIFLFYLSQRINGQEFYFEIVDASGLNYARWVLSGISATTATLQTANGGNAGTATTASINSTSGYGILEIELALEESKFFFRSIDSNASRNGNFIKSRRIPDPNLDYFIQIRAVNLPGGPATNTTLFLESVFFQATEAFTAEITGSRGSISGNDAVCIMPATSSQFQVFGNVNASISDTPTYIQEASTPLGISATFTGSGRDAFGRSNLIVTVQTNQSGTLYVDQAPDNVNFIDYGGKACVAGVNSFSFKLGLRYYRIRYVNGTMAQTIFKLFTHSYSIT